MGACSSSLRSLPHPVDQVHASLTLAVALLFGAVFMQFRQTLTTVFRNMDINHSPGLFTVQVTGS